MRRPVVAGFGVVLGVLALVVSGSAFAKGPTPKYHFELANITATPKAPAEVVVKAKALFAEIVAARPESVTLDGAPDAKTQPAELRRWLESHAIRAFAVELKIDDYQRALGPDDKAGPNGQLLTIKVGLSIVGTQMPGDALAMAGSGASTVTAEVGAALRPREEENTLDDALRDAMTHAIEDAVAKLSAPPPASKAAKPKAKK